MTKVSNSKKISVGDIIGKRIMPACAILVIALLVVLVLVMFSNSMSEWVGKLLGTEKDKTETIRLIGWAINGAFIASGLAFLSQRANAQLSATKLQADNSKKFPKRILDILYSYVRTMTPYGVTEEVKNPHSQPVKITEDMQELLDVLFKSQDIDRSDIKPNFQGVYSSGPDLSLADLRGADLRGADLRGVNLNGACLIETDLSKADLSDANLHGAILCRANLSEARLFRADLGGINLREAKLAGANLFGVDLRGVNLSDAELLKAQLGGAFYSDNTGFPEWLDFPAPPDNGDKVKFPEGFIAQKKLKSG